MLIVSRIHRVPNRLSNLRRVDQRVAVGCPYLNLRDRNLDTEKYDNSK